MRCELVCSQRSIGQAREVGAELVAKGKETARPGSEDSRGCGITGSVENAMENRAADGGANGAVTILIDDQGGGLGHEVPRRRVVFSPFEERLESIFLE